MASIPSSAEVKQQIDDIANIASDQRLLDALGKVRDAPEEQRAELANELVNPKALAAQGVPMPKGFRIALRVFEEEPSNKTLGQYTYDEATGQQTRIEPGGPPSPDLTVCASAGFYICVSVGGNLN